MKERKPCVRCARAIDGYARICPYCNWNQSQPAPVNQAVPAAVAEYRPPEERSLKQKLMFAGGGVLLLIVSFIIGMVINRDGAPKHAPEPISEQTDTAQVSTPKRADTPLVPMNEPGGIGIETPITSAPASGPVAGTPNEWDRSDATAASSVEYAQLAQRAKAEKKKVASLTDPMSLTGAAYAQGAPPAPRRPVESQTIADRVVSRTRPVPESQPIPRLRAFGAARLDLIIGPDGRVKDINVRKAIAGDNAALISAVQSWRFRPATENGHPVSAPYSVEISFRP